MRLRIALAISLMFVFVCAVGVAFAQQPQNPPAPPAQQQQGADPTGAANQAGKTTKTLTGCLQKSESGQFTLTLKDGTTWDVDTTEASIKLDEHVGHTVTVTGNATAKAASGGAKKSETAMEHSRLTATKLTHVSDTCKQ